MAVGRVEAVTARLLDLRSEDLAHLFFLDREWVGRGKTHFETVVPAVVVLGDVQRADARPAGGRVDVRLEVPDALDLAGFLKHRRRREAEGGHDVAADE